MAAFPGPARAVSTFLTSWVRLGLAKLGVLGPAQAPTCPRGSSAPWPWPRRDPTWQPPGPGCVLALHISAGWGGSCWSHSPPPWPGHWGAHCSPPPQAPLLPLRLETWRLRLMPPICGLGLGLAHGSAMLVEGRRVSRQLGGDEGPCKARKQQGAHPVCSAQSLREAFVLSGLEPWVPGAVLGRRL